MKSLKSLKNKFDMSRKKELHKEVVEVMKRNHFAILLSVLFPCLVFPLSTDNPSTVDIVDKGFVLESDYWLGFKILYEGDILYDKSLKPTSNTVSSFDNMQYVMQLGGVSLNFSDRVELAAYLGAQKFHFDMRLDPTKRLEIDTSTDLAWAIALKALLYEAGAFNFGMELEYETAHPNCSRLIENGKTLFSTMGSKLRYQEWQFSLGISYQTKFISPYLCYRYSHPRIDFKNFSRGFLREQKTDFIIKGEKKSGGAVGATISNSELFGLNFEVRFIDETAFSFSGMVKF